MKNLFKKIAAALIVLVFLVLPSVATHADEKQLSGVCQFASWVCNLGSGGVGTTNSGAGGTGHGGGGSGGNDSDD